MICQHLPSSTPPAPPAGSVSPGSGTPGGALERVDPADPLEMALQALDRARRERDQARATIAEALGVLERAGHVARGDTLAASVRHLVALHDQTHDAYLRVAQGLLDAEADVAALRAERDEHDEALHALAQLDERFDEIELEDLAAALDLAGAPRELSRSARLGWLVARAGVR